MLDAKLGSNYGVVLTSFVDLSGNIFESKAEVIVVTVNCVGVMGAGIALDAKYRWPEIKNKYVNECAEGRFSIGDIFWGQTNKQHVALFPTKNHWKLPSKIDYLEFGLSTLRNDLVKKSFRSIAVPQLGCSNGGLDWKDVRPKIVRSLDNVPDLKVELWSFHSNFIDVDFSRFRIIFLELEPKNAAKWLGCSKKSESLIRETLRNDKITNFTHIFNVEGIGSKTLERIYRAALSNKHPSIQTSIDYGQKDG